ncbi:MAG TPA: RNA-binding protein [Flavobacteriaceae bacterium]|jgi:ribosome-associated protein|nr:RNA-binding protein [Flavobacteriaceae bacterium]HBS11943.1 RNA-binding protein [Flavobacteriaceae bacterium]
MTAKNFELKNGATFIPLNKLLQVLGIAQTGGHAKIIIQNNEVLVNGTIETRVRNKLVKGSEIAVGDYVITII